MSRTVAEPLLRSHPTIPQRHHGPSAEAPWAVFLRNVFKRGRGCEAPVHALCPRFAKAAGRAADFQRWGGGAPLWQLVACRGRCSWLLRGTAAGGLGGGWAVRLASCQGWANSAPVGGFARWRRAGRRPPDRVGSPLRMVVLGSAAH